MTSTIASPSLVPNDQNKNNEMVYVPHSPYYSPVHPPEFYDAMSKLLVVYRKDVQFVNMFIIVIVKDIN